jgi:hypothetical protein
MAHAEEINIDQLELPFCSDEDFERYLEQEGLMNGQVISALEQARKIHTGRNHRHSGRPFLNEHIYPVTLGVDDYFTRRGYGGVQRAQVVGAAILHDSIETDPQFEFRILDIIRDPVVYKIVYHQTKNRDRGNTDVNDIYLRKLECGDERAQVISFHERINNLYCSIVNGHKMPDMLREYAEVTEEDFLPIADLLEDKELFDRMQSTLELSRLAMDQLGIAQPE